MCMCVYMYTINEPQLPQLLTAIYHTGLHVKDETHPVYIRENMCIAHYIAKVVAEEERKETQTQQTTLVKHKQTNTK